MELTYFDPWRLSQPLSKDEEAYLDQEWIDKEFVIRVAIPSG
jgi:hypothetical protein